MKFAFRLAAVHCFAGSHAGPIGATSYPAAAHPIRRRRAPYPPPAHRRPRHPPIRPRPRLRPPAYNPHPVPPRDDQFSSNELVDAGHRFLRRRVARARHDRREGGAANGASRTATSWAKRPAAPLSAACATATARSIPRMPATCACSGKGRARLRRRRRRRADHDAGL